jgi:hypothetical protein
MGIQISVFKITPAFLKITNFSIFYSCRWCLLNTQKIEKKNHLYFEIVYFFLISYLIITTIFILK